MEGDNQMKGYSIQASRAWITFYKARVGVLVQDMWRASARARTEVRTESGWVAHFASPPMDNLSNIFQIVDDDDVMELEELQSSGGVDYTQKNEFGDTFLHYCAELGKEDLRNVILKDPTADLLML